MSIEKLQLPATLDQERIDVLKSLLPEAVADGKFNFDTLRDLLADAIEDEFQDAEHFGLTWPGKREARRLAALPSKGTLAPAPGEGVDEEKTENIFIEGENLEVLKILKKSYASKIKMIYIDPPYNTGQDFIYKDDYSEPLESYLRRTGQSDEEGKLLVSNTKADGRFHSNWLSMIYPRLKLARELLRDDGALWISLDDNEAAKLKAIGDEIFGEENFVACFIWQKRTTRENRRVFSFNHDYLFCYAKDKDQFQKVRNLLPMTEEVLARYSNPDNDPRDVWQSVSLNAQAGHATKDQFYSITTPGGRAVELKPTDGRCWIVTKGRFYELVADNRVWFGEDGNNIPREKVFLSEAKDGLTPHTLWTADEVGTNDSAKKALTQLFDGHEVFDTPKPVELIKRIAHICTAVEESALVLDFFAGSAVTAEAILELNKDGGKRKFILVQIPDSLPENNPGRLLGFETISDVAIDRVRRAVRKISESPQDGLTPYDKTLLSFRVLKLTPSNFRRWQDQEEENIGGLILQTEQKALTPLIDGAKEADVLTEIALLEGFALSAKQMAAEVFTRNKVTCITDSFNAHQLYVCLDREMWEETIDQVEQLPTESVFYCFDNALSNAAKIQLAESCRVVTI